MKIRYFAKNYTASDKFKDLLEKKLIKLDKYFESEVDAKVNLLENAGLFRLELTLTTKGMLFRSEVESDNMFNNIDLALPKLERQIIKFNKKNVAKNKKAVFEPDLEFLNEEPQYVPASVVRNKEFDLEPISTEMAIDNMEGLGHVFYVFLNVDTDKVSVVYKRDDNNYGLIAVNY